MKIKRFNLGATGKFPRGRADEYDEGELRMAIATDYANAIVRIEFGTTVSWLGLPSAEARGLAAMLIEKANDLDKRKA